MFFIFFIFIYFLLCSLKQSKTHTSEQNALHNQVRDTKFPVAVDQSWLVLLFPVFFFPMLLSSFGSRFLLFQSQLSRVGQLSLFLPGSTISSKISIFDPSFKKSVQFGPINNFHIVLFLYFPTWIEIMVTKVMTKTLNFIMCNSK